MSEENVTCSISAETLTDDNWLEVMTKANNKLAESMVVAFHNQNILLSRYRKLQWEIFALMFAFIVLSVILSFNGVL